MSEDLTDYLLEAGIRTRYLHSEVDTLRRIELLRELRLGEYDVLVGINLLREGLDLPEVSLVAILDADKEGFLRSDKSLIQTIGRAARNVSGPGARCTPTRSRRRWRRRSTRPTAAARSRSPTTPRTASTRSRCARRSPTSPRCWPARTRTPRSCSAAAGASAPRQGAGPGAVSRRTPARRRRPTRPACPSADLAELVQQLTDQMHTAAAELQFELAARLRDEISDLKKELRQMVEAAADE